MNPIKSFLFVSVALLTMGCGNLSPRLDPRNDQNINNSDGKIEEIKSNQNGVMLELLKLKNSFDVANSQLKEVQSGLLNLNAAVSKNENSGVQILQGDGSLIVILVLGAGALYLVYHFYDKADKMKKTAEVLAAQIASFDNPDLNNSVLAAASFTDVEKDIHNILKKQVLNRMM